MKTKTITELKDKLIDTISQIDPSKITLSDLKTLAETVSIIAKITEKPFDFVDTFYKFQKDNGKVIIEDIKEE